MSHHSNYTLEELKEYIADNLDELEIIELLNISTISLVNYYEYEIIENYDDIIHNLGIDVLEEDDDIDD